MEELLKKILDFLKKIFGAARYDFRAFTGSAAIRADITYGERFKLLRVELHINTAPTTSENLTMTLDAIRGTIFDVVSYTRDLSVGSVVDLVISFGDEYVYEKDDVLVFAYTNTDARTWGLRAVIELLGE